MNASFLIMGGEFERFLVTATWGMYTHGKTQGLHTHTENQACTV